MNPKQLFKGILLHHCGANALRKINNGATFKGNATLKMQHRKNATCRVQFKVVLIRIPSSCYSSALLPVLGSLNFA